MLPLIHTPLVHAGSVDVRLAYVIARLAHAGQVDKGGQPYIDHPVRVADIAAFRQMTQPVALHDLDDEAAIDTLQTVALLHDVVEDTDVTLTDLRPLFPSHVVDAVDAISRRRGEPDDEYLARIEANLLARLVKIADSTDNSDEARLSRLSGGEADKYRRKYRGFIARLEAV